MKQLALEPEQMKRWREYREEIRETTAEIPIIDNIRFCTPEHVYAETVRYKPDVVVIDYISLMRSGRPGQKGNSMWQAITEITQDLKQNARVLGIPILAAAQTNRSGGKDGAELDNIGNSISIVQDSDKVIGLFADDEMKQRKEIEIRLNKNRRGRLGKFKALWDHDAQQFREENLRDFKRHYKPEDE
jgi:replicative DNA helicase